LLSLVSLLKTFKKIFETVRSLSTSNVAVEDDDALIPNKAMVPITYKQRSPSTIIIPLVIDVRGPVVLTTM
jgi:hypothetical protein